ncbi:MAG: hypothetical protein Kow00124_16260 [Anaerolineae bacterium]
MQNSSAFHYDHTAPLDVQQAADPRQQGGATIHDITFASPIEGRVAAYLVEPPDHVEPPYAAVLWVHWFEPEAPTSNRTQFLDEALALAPSGVVSLLVDGFWATTPAHWAAYPHYRWRTDYEHDSSLCIKQVVDLRRALDLLATRMDIDRQRIACVGHDFGAMYGAIVAGVDTRVKAYALLAGTFTFGDWFLYGSDLDDEAEKDYIERMAWLAPVHYVKQAAPARLLFQFARADFYVPERAAMIFYDAASEPKEIRWYEAGHDLEDSHGTPRRDREAWLREVLELRS